MNELYEKKTRKGQNDKDMQLSRDDFNFVQKDQKIYDKELETKPVGYFKDAMIRFGKNRTNVVASLILLTLILMSILVPALTTKTFDDTEHQVRLLPPRIPILERYGIFDGTRLVEDIRVDRDTIDPETGLGLPSPTGTHQHEYILMDTLENYARTCTALEEHCYGGYNRLQMLPSMESVSLYSTKSFLINPSDYPDPQLVINIDSMTEESNTELHVYMAQRPNDYKRVATITEAGEHRISPLDAMDDPGWANTNIEFILESEDETAYVQFESVKYYHDAEDEDPEIHDYGYDLALYHMPPGEHVLTLAEGYGSVSILSHRKYDIHMGRSPVITLNVDDMTESENTQANVYLDPHGDGEYELIGSFTEAGEHEFHPAEELGDVSNFDSPLKIELVSDVEGASLVLTRARLADANDPDLVDDTRRIRQYFMDGEGGTFITRLGGGEYRRVDGEDLFARFRYDRYGHAFGDRDEVMGSSEYYAILAANPEYCEEELEHPDGIEGGWGFHEECPITAVDSRTSDVPYDGRQVMHLGDESERFAIISNEEFEINIAEGPYFEINIIDIFDIGMAFADEDYNTALNLYMDPEGDGEWRLLETFTEAGTHGVPVRALWDDVDDFESRLKIELVSDHDLSTATLRRIRLMDDTTTIQNPIREYTGRQIARNFTTEGSGSLEPEIHYSYRVTFNYARYAGYDTIPYYIAGTTDMGRDLFAATFLALRTSLFLGVAVNLVNITIGVVYGAIEGYYGGKVDLLLERFAEVIGRVPWLVTLSVFVALLGPGMSTLFFILIFSGWVGISGITRTQFYRFKRREYVLASRTLGAKDSRLIFRHILPNGIGTIITMSILAIPMIIFIESTISYLGFGIGYGTHFSIGPFRFSGVSIGVLLADARRHIHSHPYLTVMPAIVISILMITFNMFGNALRDAFNPSLRGVE